MTIVLTLAAMFALLLMRIPVAFALGGLGLAMLLLGGFSPLMAPQAVLSTLDGFILLAVPLFLLMSNILLRAGLGMTCLLRSVPGSVIGRGALRWRPSCLVVCLLLFPGSSVATGRRPLARLPSLK